MIWSSSFKKIIYGILYRILLTLYSIKKTTLNIFQNFGHFRIFLYISDMKFETLSLTEWAIIDCLCKDGCLLKSTMSPSCKCLCTMSPYLSSLLLSSLLFLFLKKFKSTLSPDLNCIWLAPGYKVVKVAYPGYAKIF